MELLTFVTVNGTLKLENRNWKFGLHAFCIVNERIQFWAGFLTIALSSVVCVIQIILFFCLFSLSQSHHTISDNASAGL